MIFSIKAREMGFEAVEYVSSLYWNELETKPISMVTKTLLNNSKNNGIKNLLIMVDGEGDLASKNKNKRQNSIDNHKKMD